MKSNWLWLSSIINESNGSLHLQVIWQMAPSIYYCACYSGSFSKWFILWNLVIKGFALQAFSRFWHSLCYFFFLWLWQKKNNHIILSEFIFYPSTARWIKQENVYVFIQPMRKYVGLDKWLCRKVWSTQWPNIEKKDLLWRLRSVQGAVFNQNLKAYKLKKIFFGVHAKINDSDISESWVNPGKSLK